MTGVTSRSSSTVCTAVLDGAASLGISHGAMLAWLRTHNFPASLAER